MDFFLRGLNEESANYPVDIHRCPFLRNINEPTNFSFFSSLPFPIPVLAGKGPIFEDVPNFDVAFRLFHGRDGVVPLSERSGSFAEKKPQATLPAFNPLAAKAATISLSSFGLGGPFGFDAFSRKWQNDKRRGKSSKKWSVIFPGDSIHEASRDEWLRTGNCSIAKSYRAVSNVLPHVAKVIQPPPGMKLKCPRAVVAARAALSRTALAKNLRPQPLPAKVFVIGMLGMAANVPLGIWREHTKKFSPSWFVAVHAAVPFIAILRKSVLMPKSAMAFTIAASVLGQVIGSRAERYRLKAIAEKGQMNTVAAEGQMNTVAAEGQMNTVAAEGQMNTVASKGGMPLDETPIKGSSQLAMAAVKAGHCGDLVGHPVSLQMAVTTFQTDVYY